MTPPEVETEVEGSTTLEPGATDNSIESETQIDESTNTTIVITPPAEDDGPAEVAAHDHPHEHPHEHIGGCPECMADVRSIVELEREQAGEAGGVAEAPTETVIEGSETEATETEARTGHVAPGWF